MARRLPRDRRRKTAPEPTPKRPETPTSTASSPPEAPPVELFWSRPRRILAVVLLLGVHAILAVTSLVRENPTIDEVAHLPAGISYWQTGTYRLYPHNPPLVKMLAALPVLWAKPETERLYQNRSWTSEPPVHASIAHEFAVANAERYFELFTRARMVIPSFSVLGGLVIYAWSRRLFGTWGGLLSLTLWALSPNILAHARLVTTDIGATSLGVAATFLFWIYLKQRTPRRAALAGFALGLAVLAKFSNLLLFGLWPLIWLAEELARGRVAWPRRLLTGVRHGALVILLSVLTINLGYRFEGTGTPLGSFEFTSASLTTPRPPGTPARFGANGMVNMALQHRVNRFRNTWIGALPSPLPAPFWTGFDVQKFESEGIPRWFVDPSAPRDETIGYPVYLDGVLRDSGWWYYYLAAAAYKIPEGTWVLVLLALGVLGFSRRSRPFWPDLVAVGIVPAVVFGVMSFGTDINLGLRYILPAFPYVFILMGVVATWAAGLAGRAKWTAISLISLCLIGNAASVAWIHPHYLAFFNRVSGGPSRGSEHLIDSNVDWGQDLVNLRDWLQRNAPGERVGLAYFGQINPNLLRLREQGFDWFLAPPIPGGLRPINPNWDIDGPPPRLEPGLYAVSASFLRGLPYAMYDSSLRIPNLYPAWDARSAEVRGAYTYFQQLEPIAQVGYSISLYRVSAEDAARLAPLWDRAG